MKKIKLEREARQGDNISPRLFTSCLQDAIIKRIDWEGRGLIVDGERLSHLIFAHDIIFLAKSTKELNSMLIDIHKTSKPVGLNMHLGKTKLMFKDRVSKSTISVDDKIIEEADSYVYSGKTLTRDGDLLPKIGRRIALGWAVFFTIDNVMRSRKTSMKIKRKIHDEYILPVITYGNEK